ncbi:restriction endonuclease [Patescibacteria group bacterium]|nr:restriction endonuclease [Patescibacteria group bacterium]MBU4452663.1 restriction endonuclease [Patescibacteria group bacterium]MCG2687962.1 restriction endonuclease [Candidatus Parcubacteria bacterium]
MQIIKSSGKRVEFDPEKVRTSVLRTGASSEVADSIVADLQKRLHNGMTTAQIYKIVFEDLKKQQKCLACRYDLRSALLRLGPAGYKFEKYVASILCAYGYDAHAPQEDYEGACVPHEIDVVAQKDRRMIFIEAKFRNNFYDVVNLKDVLATWARFLDLVDGSAVGKCPHFDEVWIVTNARFTDVALEYGVCKGIHMIGWNVPKERTFAQMVDHIGLYPVTVLDEIKQSELEQLSNHDLLLCRDVAKKEPDELAQKLDVSETRALEIIKMCSEVIEIEPGS